MTNTPAIILVKPQLGENIGTAARAMHNGGLKDLRLVKPKLGWPNERAIKPAAGGAVIVESARVFETVEDAIADLNVVYATTARERGMNKPIFTPRKAAEQFHGYIGDGEKVGILFGPERTGLNNDDISRVDAIINVPLNPEYTSLNLAQCVLLIAYEWYQGIAKAPDEQLDTSGQEIASKQEVTEMFQHLEHELDRGGFLRVEHMRPTMVRNIRNIFQRRPLTSQEVRTLRGIIKNLVDPYHARD
ncbi:MAG: RNA methyltransferase [Alphaproteobacteria bacterium]